MRELKSIMIMIFAGAALALGGCATGGQGSDRGNDFSPEQVSVPEYREFLQELQVAVDEGVPREFNDREMNRFQRLNTKLLNLLEDHESIEDMTTARRQEIYNTHQELQALVSGKREYQVICKRRRTVGTNFKTTECYTRQEWQEVSDRSRRFMEDQMRSPMTAPPGS